MRDEFELKSLDAYLFTLRSSFAVAPFPLNLVPLLRVELGTPVSALAITS